MSTYYQESDAIEGEKIAFHCRKFRRIKKPVPSTSAHRAQAGTLDLAYCVIVKRFRSIPENKEIKTND